jgi:hypothetical protein
MGVSRIEVQIRVPNRGFKLGSQIGVPNQCPKSGSQIRVGHKPGSQIGVPNRGPKSGSQIGVPNRCPKSGIPIRGPKSGSQTLPNLQQICPRLYNYYRMMFIPAAPKTQSELATHIMLRDLLTQKFVHKFWLLILDTPEHVDSNSSYCYCCCCAESL